MVSSIAFLLFAADSLGRRKSLLVSSIGQAATLYVIGVYDKLYPNHSSSVSSKRSLFVKTRTEETDAWGRCQIPPLGYVAIVCVYLYVL